jgi:hypothetical protein
MCIQKVKGIYTETVKVSPESQKLDPKDADFIMLSNNNSVDDGVDSKTIPVTLSYDTSDLEIYFGFAENPQHQLFPTQTTQLIPISNASDISVRCVEGKTRVLSYSLFKIIS